MHQEPLRTKSRSRRRSRPRRALALRSFRRDAADANADQDDDRTGDLARELPALHELVLVVE